MADPRLRRAPYPERPLTTSVDPTYLPFSTPSENIEDRRNEPVLGNLLNSAMVEYSGMPIEKWREALDLLLHHPFDVPPSRQQVVVPAKTEDSLARQAGYEDIPTPHSPRVPIPDWWLR